MENVILSAVPTPRRSVSSIWHLLKMDSGRQPLLEIAPLVLGYERFFWSGHLHTQGLRGWRAASERGFCHASETADFVQASNVSSIQCCNVHQRYSVSHRSSRDRASQEIIQISPLQLRWSLPSAVSLILARENRFRCSFREHKWSLECFW